MAGPYYRNDAGGSRYSASTQIKRSNLDRLEIAWQFRTGQLGQGFKQGKKLTFETTPVLSGRVLYFSTAFGEVFAIDAVSGAKIWRFDSDLPKGMTSGDVSSRGVTIWQDSKAQPADVCAKRLFFGNIAGRLFAQDAATGKRCTGFGDYGAIDLRKENRRAAVRGNIHAAEHRGHADESGLCRRVQLGRPGL